MNGEWKHLLCSIILYCLSKRKLAIVPLSLPSMERQDSFKIRERERITTGTSFLINPSVFFFPRNKCCVVFAKFSLYSSNTFVAFPYNDIFWESDLERERLSYDTRLSVVTASRLVARWSELVKRCHNLILIKRGYYFVVCCYCSFLV